MHAFNSFDAFMGRFHSYVGNLVGLSIGLFAISISLDLFLRMFGLGNLPGVQEIIEYVLFAGVFLAAPWVLRLGGHVRVDLILSGLPLRIARRMEWALDILGFAICLTLIWFGSINLSQAYAYQSLQMKYFNVPEWWLLTVFVVSFVLLSVEFLSRLLRGGTAPKDSQAHSGGL